MSLQLSCVPESHRNVGVLDLGDVTEMSIQAYKICLL